jgi:putative copper export protein
MPEPAHAYVELLAAAPARLLAYAAILLTVGAAVWRLWVLPRSAQAVAAAPEAFARARQAVTFVGALAGAGGVVASAWQLSAQLATLGDPADPGGGPPMMGALVLHTAWGRFWGAQTGAFAVAALAFWAAHRAGRHGAADPWPGATTWIAGAAALAGAALQAGLGHALADEHAPTLALASAALHVSGVALWLGTLAALAVAWLALAEQAAELHDAPVLPRPAAATAARAERVPARTLADLAAERVAALAAAQRAADHAAALARPVADPPRRRPPAALVGPQVAAFTPLALAGAAATLLAGAANAWLRLTPADPMAPAAARLAALTGSTYGRLLLAKLALVGVVAAAGAVNWRRNGPRLLARNASSGVAVGAADAAAHAPAADAPAALDRAVRLELGAAALALLLSAALALSSPPGTE